MLLSTYETLIFTNFNFTASYRDISTFRERTDRLNALRGHASSLVNQVQISRDELRSQVRDRQ